MSTNDQTIKLKVKGPSLDEFKPLSEAEEKLLEACKDGEIAELGEARPKKAPDDKDKIRPEVVRLLALRADPENAPVHERGVRVKGAGSKATSIWRTAPSPWNLICNTATSPVASYCAMPAYSA